MNILHIRYDQFQCQSNASFVLPLRQYIPKTHCVYNCIKFCGCVEYGSFEVTDLEDALITSLTEALEDGGAEVSRAYTFMVTTYL